MAFRRQRQHSRAEKQQGGGLGNGRELVGGLGEFPQRPNGFGIELDCDGSGADQWKKLERFPSDIRKGQCREDRARMAPSRSRARS